MNKKNILLIDDNDIYTVTIQKYLEEDGHSVSFCNKGPDAIKLSQELTFHFIFIDYRMPEMRGDVVCRLLREQTPFSFIVGFSIENREQDFLEAGADAFILKEEFFRDIDNILHKVGHSHY